MIAAVSVHPNRHAELVSASMAPQAASSPAEGWTLKLVQGDGRIEAVRGLSPKVARRRGRGA